MRSRYHSLRGLPLLFLLAMRGVLSADEWPETSSIAAMAWADSDAWKVDTVPFQSPQGSPFGPASPGIPAFPQPAGALSGRIVLMSGGHGWTFNNSANTWYTQRGVTQEMNEDYGNLDQMTLFAAYCFNAGATVVPMRPVGYQTNEVVLDNVSPAVAYSGTWFNSTASLYYGNPGDVPYRYTALAPTETATATYTPAIPVSDFYPAYTWVAHGDNRTSQLYRINHTGGQTLVRIPHHIVGNGWVYLGSYFFEAGSNPLRGSVIVSNLQPNPSVGSVVIADAIRFGNGMGSIVRTSGGAPSGYPREEEAARYWIQASLGQGQAPSIYDTGSDDESDNVGAPIRMAREMNRTTVETNMYKRVYISFHSNAGGGRGTLGLYNDSSLFPGTATPNQLRLAQLLGKEVNDDLSAMPGLEVPWFNRGANVTYARSDFAFGEIRGDVLGGEMDATILEVAFHDSPDDARLLRDPKVRLACARAACHGVVRYMNEFDSGPLVFPPEPPTNVRSISAPAGGITVSWAAPVTGGGSGTPTGYAVYRSLDGYGFGESLLVIGPSASSVTITNLLDETDYYFRVAAINAGGESLPSPTIGSQRNAAVASSRVLFVNAFDRFERRLNLRQTPTPGVYAPPGSTGAMDRVIPRRNNAFDYVVQHGRALHSNGVAFDSCQNEAIVSGLVAMENYTAVIWGAGNESTADETFSAVEQSKIAAYLSSGGQLFVSGAEIGWDLDRSSGPTTADRFFLRQQLHASLNGDANDDSQTYFFSPATNSIFTGDLPGRFDDGRFGIYAVGYPDVLTVFGAGTIPALDYVGGLGGAAALQYDGSAGGGRVVIFGFPFETILSPEIRASYLADILKFFSLLPAPVLMRLQVDAQSNRVSLTWTAIRGKSYQGQFKNSLLEPQWQDLGAPVVASSATASQTDIVAGSPQRYYRVLLRE